MVRDYKAMGVQDISVTATNKGVYVWAGMGFGWSDPGEGRYMAKGLAKYVAERKGIPEAQAMAAIAPHASKPWEFAQIRIGGERVAKDWMLGADTAKRAPWEGGQWTGTLRLRDGDEGYEHAKRVLVKS